LSRDQFIAAVRSDFQGQRLQVKRLGRVHDLAATSIGLSEGIEALQLGLGLHLDLVAVLQQQQQWAATTLIDCFLTLPEAAYMLSVPGLGPLTAAIILSEIGDPNHYTSGRQWVKLAGIQPVPNTSGRKSRSRTPMSRQGRPRLRTALFFAVMRLVRLDQHFAQHHLHLQTRLTNPLAKNQALGVLMNKLLRLLWALIRQQTFYQPDYQPPP
jgi:transposase